MDAPPLPAAPAADPVPAPGPTTPGRRGLLWPALAMVGAIFPLAVIIAAGKTFSTRDTVHLFEPLRPLVVEALRAGRLPLWNPHEALGMPLFAQPQHATLHPLMILHALLTPSAGLEWVAICHVALAALGAFALARRLGATPGAGAVAGLGFALSGYALSMTGNLPYLAAASAAPFVVLSLRAAAAGTRFATPASAAAVAVLLLAGDPQWAIVAVALGAALAIEAGGARGLARALAGAALGGGLAAVQLLPTWALVQESSRASGMSVAERAQWAFAPWRTLELVAPGFFAGRPGAGAADVFQRLGGTDGYAAPFILSVHVGAVLITLAVVGARASRAGRVLAWTALASAWLAYGVHLGADALFRHVPIWGAFRYSEKLVGPLTLCVALLAGLGVDRLTPPLRDRVLRAVVPIAGVAVVALVVLAIGDAAWLQGWLGDAAAAGRARLLVGLAHLAAGLLLLVALLVAARSAAASGLAAALAALVFVQGAAAAPFALHAGEPGVRDAAPLRDVRSPEPVTRVETPSRSGANAGPAWLDPMDRTVFQDSRMGVAPYNVPGGVDQLAPYSPLWPARFERVWFAFLRDFEEGRWIAWRRFAVDRAVVDVRVTPEGRRAAEAAIQGATKILQDGGAGFSVWEPPHRPWASFAPRMIPAPDEVEAYRRLAEAIAAGADDVVVEGAPPLPTAPGRVLGVQRGREEVRIEAEAGGDGLLVVNDAYWPGWSAAIDGSAVPILRADVLVRAVPWPAGRHVLVMRYDPPEVRAGAGLSAAAAIVLAVLLGLEVRRRRRA